MEHTDQIVIRTGGPLRPLGDLFGIFFEDLNHAADGGLYAELVQNRSFEFCPVDHPDYHALTAWEKVEHGGAVELSIRTAQPFCEKNPHYLRVDILRPGGDTGVRNLGFNSGMAFRKGAEYHFTCYARSPENSGVSLQVSLRGSGGGILAQEQIHVSGDWNKYQLTLSPAESTIHGNLVLTMDQGTVELDFISLFPPTYKGRENGLRIDLAEKLEALKPRFLRFPGGCLIHDGTLDPEARDSQYRWKNSIGPVELRPARRNNWGYNQTLGLGYYEYFLFCEDIGAKPLPVLPGGYDPHHHRAAEGEVLRDYVQDALDLIEFANGAADTVWGAKRSEMGHPEPFGLEYIGIGNEEVGQEFFDRYPLFHRAIREKYPDIKIIGTSGPFAAGREYDLGWASARAQGADLVDEHYYQSPEWFIAHHDRYKAFPQGPKVFVGEYASHGSTWFNALAEASYMIGLQNCAQSVGLACYAPLLCNADYVNWQPDMIWFDQSQVMLTPNYYVQKLFMNHQGDTQLAQTVTGGGPDMLLDGCADCLPGEVLLAVNQSEMLFTGIEVLDGQGQTIYSAPSLRLGRVCGERSLCRVDGGDYMIRLKAKELEGFKGFQVKFGQRNRQNGLYWKLGGWANGDSMLGQTHNGSDSVLTQQSFSVEKGRTYQLEIQVRGTRIKTWLDGEPNVETQVLPVLARPIYAASSRDETSGDVIVKLVNLLPKEQNILISLCDTAQGAWAGTLYQMSGYSRDQRNSLDTPDVIRDAQAVSVALPDGTLQMQMPPESVCVLRTGQLENLSDL